MKTGSPFDPYNFSEIEKIQQDIERDLMAVEMPAGQPLTQQPELLKEDSDFFPDVTELSPVPEYSVEDVISHPAGTQLIETTESFYTETIKQEPLPFSKRLAPYRRMIAVLLVICTVGTGSLGIGIGFGVVLLQRHMGIYGYSGSDDFQAAYVETIENTRLIFGSESGGISQDGSLADIVRLVDPAVVRITTVPRQREIESRPFDPFGGLIPPNPFGNEFHLIPSERNINGGSGIIIAQDNERVFIVTNDHVTHGSSEVHISIMDSESIPAGLVGRNFNADIAVLSVSLEDVHRVGIRRISIAVFGDSDLMQVGDVVLAIGNAMGEGNSTTSGIISAGEKEIEAAGRTNMRVLQTDAAINPGSSGGPLVNKQGEVIGINTTLAAAEQRGLERGIEGMGFSIPSNAVKPIIEEIMNSAPRPFLGIQGHDINDRIAAEYGILPIGAYVDSVFSNSSAASAGIQSGDIIISFNNHIIFDMDQLREEIGRSSVGDTVEVTILRRVRERVRETITIQVTLGTDPTNNF